MGNETKCNTLALLALMKINPSVLHGIHAWMHATNGFTCVLTTSATRQQWPQQSALSKLFLPIDIYIFVHCIDDKRIFRSNKLANILGAESTHLLKQS
jgi:hypothetical protein